MPGFGSWPFGTGPFGEYSWSKHVLWKDLPEVDKRLDREQADGRLELFVDSIRPSFDEIGSYIQGFGELRDPDLVRTQYQQRLDVNVLLSYSTATGRTIEALVEKTDESDPFSPLENSSTGWILEDGAGREYTVNSVHKLWDAGPMLELTGTAELPVSAFSLGTDLTGLLSFSTGSVTVVGSGTAFLAEVVAGQYIVPDVGGRFVGKIETVVNNTTITLSEPWRGENRVSVAGVVVTASDGASKLRPPALLPYLGSDFGVEVDQYEPESFQRSSVRDAKQWLVRKGAQRGYDIIGKISGYRVVAYGLWRIGSIPAWLSPEEVYEIPPGSGKYYTSVDPLLPSFDDIAADVIPLDYACRETPNWTSEAITPPIPSPPDGTPVEAAIGYLTQGLSISGVTELGGGWWRIQVGPGVDLWPIAFIGQWYANFPTISGGKFFLETQPVEVVAGTWEFEIVAGETPTFGATVNIDYECGLVINCDFCRSSLLRIEVIPVEVLTEPDVSMEDATGRLLRKIDKAVPVHVRRTDMVYAIGPVEVSLNPSAQVSTPP